ncbi:hypothetical protein NDU88_005082 [Pleurodeles waltl]|uniref:Uncharacterized protein n=1 Tax=Pleurodeles waltl TaxID=8319 RepID=A0AAV7MVC6_PLEWA|nr:hypothetical protein NDU88_005082 [Pleurodeles waltl]
MRDNSLKDLFAKTPAKKRELPTEAPPVRMDEIVSTAEDDAQVTRSILEQYFVVLREYFATLKQTIVSEVKDLRRDVGDLGPRVYLIEQTYDSSEEELDNHPQELLELRDKDQGQCYSWRIWKTDPANPKSGLKGFLYKRSLGTWKLLPSVFFVMWHRNLQIMTSASNAPTGQAASSLPRPGTGHSHLPALL